MTLAHERDISALVPDQLHNFEHFPKHNSVANALHAALALHGPCLWGSWECFERSSDQRILDICSFCACALCGNDSRSHIFGEAVAFVGS